MRFKKTTSLIIMSLTRSYGPQVKWDTKMNTCNVTLRLSMFFKTIILKTKNLSRQFMKDQSGAINLIRQQKWHLSY